MKYYTIEDLDIFIGENYEELQKLYKNYTKTIQNYTKTIQTIQKLYKAIQPVRSNQPRQD